MTGEENTKKEEMPAPETSIPEAPVQPQVIHIEKQVKASVTATQILGILLLSIALLCFVLFACFGKSHDLPEAAALCLPVALWGVLCLLTKQPLLWCCWCGSGTWWVYLFVLAARWERAVLFLTIGILLVVLSLSYTVYLHKKGRIHVPAWTWALLTIILAGAALLLMLNLLPPAGGQVTRPSEITAIP